MNRKKKTNVANENDKPENSKEEGGKVSATQSIRKENIYNQLQEA